MTDSTMVSLTIDQLLKLIISIIGIILIPLIIFLWKTINTDIRELRNDIKDLRDRMTRVEDRIDALPKEFETSLISFENQLLKTFGGDDQ